MTWTQLSDMLAQLEQLYQNEWNCEPPGYNQMPSDAVESECDEWCRKLARNAGDHLPAPLHVQPWILARIAISAASVRGLEGSGQAPPQKLTVDFFEELFVDDWHAALKERWMKLGRLGGSESRSE
jgi:hypothetical protein